ncbi:MRG domain-containing protein [Phthorimaea operculella]|nr:MRG domain-containing protein [Phthorimaea operculella]
MVSTRGVRYKFSEGERVLCYEPDPTKAKVLYDSKVLEVIEGKDKRGRRTIEYLIHFQGWNSSWDRCVSEDFVLKDTEENRQLQRDLAEKSQLQLGAYLYRRERKKGSGSSGTAAGSGAGKRARHVFSDDGSSSSTQPDEGEAGDTDSSSGDGSGSQPQSPPPASQPGRAQITLPSALRDRLTFDYHLVVKRGKLVRLPASPTASEILESFVKWFARAGAWHPQRARHDPPQRPDLTDVSCRLNLVREVADGLRVYFDFVLPGHLLYKQELNQYHEFCGQYAKNWPLYTPGHLLYKQELNQYHEFCGQYAKNWPLYTPGHLLYKQELNQYHEFCGQYAKKWQTGPPAVQAGAQPVPRVLRTVRQETEPGSLGGRRGHLLYKQELNQYHEFCGQYAKKRGHLLYKQELNQYHEFCGQYAKKRGHLLYKQELNQYHEFCGQYAKKQEEEEAASAAAIAAIQDNKADIDIKSPKIPEYSHLPPDPSDGEKNGGTSPADNFDSLKLEDVKEEATEKPASVAAIPEPKSTEEAPSVGVVGPPPAPPSAPTAPVVPAAPTALAAPIAAPVAPVTPAPTRTRETRLSTRSGNLARRLRSHKWAVSHSEAEEPAASSSTAEPRAFETLSSSLGSSGSSLSECWSRPAQPAANAPNTACTRTPLSQLLDKVTKWQLLGGDQTPHLPCRTYGAIHLARLFVKLPDFLNATSMPDFKLKYVLKHIDMFIQYLDEHEEWFGESYYIADGTSRSH